MGQGCLCHLVLSTIFILFFETVLIMKLNFTSKTLKLSLTKASPSIQPCPMRLYAFICLFLHSGPVYNQTLFSERAWNDHARSALSLASVKVEEGKVEGGQTASKSKVGLLHVCVFFLRFSIHCTHNWFFLLNFLPHSLQVSFVEAKISFSASAKETGRKPTPVQRRTLGSVLESVLREKKRNTTFKFIYNQNDI